MELGIDSRCLILRVHYTICILWRLVGGLAQLGERLPCKQEVSGSIPLISTRAAKLRPHLKPSASGFKWERKQSEANDTKLLLTTGQ